LEATRGLTRELSGVFGGVRGEINCGDWRRVRGRQISRFGCACTPAYGSAEAPAAQHLLAWLKPRPIKAARLKPGPSGDWRLTQVSEVTRKCDPTQKRVVGIWPI